MPARVWHCPCILCAFFYLTDTEYFRIKFPFYGVFLNRLYSLTFARLLMNENTDAFSECFVFLLRLILLRWCVWWSERLYWYGGKANKRVQGLWKKTCLTTLPLSTHVHIELEFSSFLFILLFFQIFRECKCKFVDGLMKIYGLMRAACVCQGRECVNTIHKWKMNEIGKFILDCKYVSMYLFRSL